VHPHRFRDTFAVDMLARGATPYDVAKLLGDEIATVAVESEWPSSVHRARPLSRSHTFSVLSQDADTARFPSADTATPLTESEAAFQREDGVAYCCAFINDYKLIAGDAGGRLYFLKFEQSKRKM
jgi:hypothetical protein